MDSKVPIMPPSAGDMTIEDLWGSIKFGGLAAWSRTPRRLRAGLAMIAFFIFSFVLFSPSVSSTSALPTISLDYNPKIQGPQSPYNASKVALLIENRADPILSPLTLHFMSVVPPDWRFRFMGSIESVAHMNKSRPIRDAVASGKLDLTYIPANMTTASQEEISVFLTNLWVYEQLLAPAEWLLIFQTDSMLCANSRQSLNSFLDYDWVGAPWNPHGRFGGNGGLSLRRVSRIVDILRNQERPPNGGNEDVWLTDRLGTRPNAKLANGTASLTFSAEMHSGRAAKVGAKKKGQGNKDPGFVKGVDDWREGFYEPMGYHTGGSGNILHGSIWGSPERRAHIWNYCPEVKMTLKMDVAKYVPGDCGAKWKRGEEAWDGLGGKIETEVINGVEYPLLPAELTGW